MKVNDQVKEHYREKTDCQAKERHRMKSDRQAKRYNRDETNDHRKTNRQQNNLNLESCFQNKRRDGDPSAGSSRRNDK